jgi:GTPase SAR1 family protein
VFNIALVGDQKVGKTALRTALCNLEFTEKNAPTSELISSSKEINFPNGQSKIVILSEIPLIELCNQSPENLETSYDLILVCFEHSNDLKKFLKENYRFLPQYTPKIGVHCKSDRNDFEIYMDDNEDKELEEYGIKKIVECSAKKGEVRELLSNIYSVISKP